MNEKIPEDLKEVRRTNLKISSLPVKTLDEFKNFCLIECGDSYALGLTYLLNIKKQWDNIIPFLSEIKTEIAKMKEDGHKTKLKTLGGEEWQT